MVAELDDRHIRLSKECQMASFNPFAPAALRAIGGTDSSTTHLFWTLVWAFCRGLSVAHLGGGGAIEIKWFGSFSRTLDVRDRKQ